jgi:hypothetical protein
MQRHAIAKRHETRVRIDLRHDKAAVDFTTPGKVKKVCTIFLHRDHLALHARFLFHVELQLRG